MTTKTIFCDIDGTLLKHFGNIKDNIENEPIILDSVLNTIHQWEKLNYKIILTTGRKECTRKITEEQLLKCGIVYDSLIMGVTNGDRVLINDKKLNGINNTAYAINLVRNKGLTNYNLTSKNVTIDDSLLFTKIEKPWGYEELIECNDKYVVKKLFMKKGHSCSIQYHELKTETIIVLNGLLNIYIGSTVDTLNEKIYSHGETVTIKPYTVHRMEAVEDCTYIETSTNELWDVIRLQDNYNRV
jgi:quercetin dioxygenase-like cupin family protein|uniref:Mannose-6-phosphate isomerase type II C-terminal domain-containing protein n=1 Tax=viral metagenome TaxID=1070528 RepID=A0A6C0CW42_9ZZZZ